jgi:capsular exopolysaccharide synthesis family protein
MGERADRTIQEPGETAFFLNIPELGIIPSESAGTRVRVRIANKKLSDAIERATVKEAGPSMSRERIELATWQQRPSMVAESFRATLVSILFSGTNGNRPRVMAVSSSGPGEGKSTVVSNLGIAVAEVNQRTLVIDADLRKPRLHEIFNLSNDRGLSDLLRSKEPLTFIPEGVIQETGIPELYILTSGSKTAAATSLLYSTRMPELLRTLRTEFETIFIDTPPMLQIPDARVLGRMVDRVIMVVRAGKTTRDAAQAAHQRFAEDGTRLLGTILNDWNPKRSPNGYYGNYNGYYGGYRSYYGSNKSTG